MPGERWEGHDVEERPRRMADFPLSAAAGAEVFQNYDRQFEEGLELVLAGIGTTYAMTYGNSS
ncbi:TetR/AcrR family transcriptional regulator C-terminal domain-containing protein [Streptomyces sp. WI04-05B]|uniref:TetR/AcrR family transcriptional regulator C-terminal domain-containing protein n=1 Tax=Streptomyces TaxID=1883 RepID=UPI0039F46210